MKQSTTRTTTRVLTSISLLISLLVLAGSTTAAAAATDVGHNTIVIGYDPGTPIGDPCTGEVLGYFDSGTLTIEQRWTTTGSGVSVYRTMAEFQGLAFTSLAGVQYRIIARGNNVTVFPGSGFIDTITSTWIIMGPTGPSWLGQSLSVRVYLSGGPSVDFQRASSDASCVGG